MCGGKRLPESVPRGGISDFPGRGQGRTADCIAAPIPTRYKKSAPHPFRNNGCGANQITAEIPAGGRPQAPPGMCRSPGGSSHSPTGSTRRSTAGDPIPTDGAVLAVCPRDPSVRAVHRRTVRLRAVLPVRRRTVHRDLFRLRNRRRAVRLQILRIWVRHRVRAYPSPPFQGSSLCCYCYNMIISHNRLIVNRFFEKSKENFFVFVFRIAKQPRIRSDARLRMLTKNIFINKVQK